MDSHYTHPPPPLAPLVLFGCARSRKLMFVSYYFNHVSVFLKMEIVLNWS